MKILECTIFNVDHGFCSFIKSPNNYGLLIDCGSRERFSPVKWIRGQYNFSNENIQYYGDRRIAKAIISHLHMDHFDDVGSLIKADKPKQLLRDKESLHFIDEKIKQEKDEVARNTLIAFRDFQKEYTEPSSDIDWGFDFFKHSQISYKDASEISSTPDKLINNRSYLVVVEYGGKKILFPGDIEVEGWLKAFENQKTQEIIADVDFFVASHHGHKSGFTSAILEYTGVPDIYIVSAQRGDEHVDSSYSNSIFSNGYLVEGDTQVSRMISTRDRGNSIRIVACQSL